MTDTFDPLQVEADVRRWLECAVIGLNLCPFAKAVYAKDQVRIVVSDAHMLIASMHPEVGHPELFDTARNNALWADYEAARINLIEALGGRA